MFKADFSARASYHRPEHLDHVHVNEWVRSESQMWKAWLCAVLCEVLSMKTMGTLSMVCLSELSPFFSVLQFPLTIIHRSGRAVKPFGIRVLLLTETEEQKWGRPGNEAK